YRLRAVIVCSFVFAVVRLPPRPTLFPYTTLFRSELLGGDTVELGVQLQGSDELAGTGDLEVHVTEGVLGTEDVGQGDELVPLTDQPHGDARNHLLERDTGRHQRHGGGADRTHRRRTVGTQRLGDLTDGVREFLTRRQDRQQGTLGKSTVPDLTPLG